MEKLIVSPKIRFVLKEYMRWYYKNFLPMRQYSVFLKVEEGKICIYFSYDLTEEINDCIRKCKKSRDYDDCFMTCYEDVVDATEEFLFEQPDVFEKLLMKRGVETEFDYDWGGGGEKTFRWARICVPHV